jgi:hypothetical protein
MSSARVTRFVIERRTTPAFDGRAFGTAGAYEVIVGRVHVSLDPGAPDNAAIAGLDMAPVNAESLVEYSSQVAILRPIDLARGSARLVYQVINRSLSDIDPAGRAMTGTFNMVEALLERGDIFVGAAWQGEMQADRNNPFSPAMLELLGGWPLYCDLPMALENGRPAVRRIRQELEAFDLFTGQMSSRATLVYPAAAQPDIVVMSRRHEADDPTPLPAEAVELINDRTLEIDPVAGAAVYDIHYNATDPIVSGIGLAVPRDLIAFLRDDPGDGAGRVNPLVGADGRPAVTHAYAYGISQSGRYLRSFLWLGFNRGPDGRAVFDGVLPIIAGGKKGYFNQLFALPGVIPGELSGHRDPAIWPFAYPVLDDPLSGTRDGILKRCGETGTCPKIIHLDTENEVVAGYGWMLTTQPDGLPISQQPDNLRLYALSGAEHGFGGFRPSFPICRAPMAAPVPMMPFLRAAIALIDDWVRLGKAPPLSRYPTLADGTLTTVELASASWPAITGYPFNAARNVAEHWVSETPLPRSTGRYPLLTPAIDGDGNALGGIAHPLLAVPTGTMSGTTARKPGLNVEDIAPLAGEYIPFPRSRAEGLAAGDLRPSLEERYPGGDAELRRRRRAVAEALAAEGLLLAGDVDAAADGSLDEGFDVVPVGVPG